MVITILLVHLFSSLLIDVELFVILTLLLYLPPVMTTIAAILVMKIEPMIKPVIPVMATPPAAMMVSSNSKNSNNSSNNKYGNYRNAQPDG